MPLHPWIAERSELIRDVPSFAAAFTDSLYAGRWAPGGPALLRMHATVVSMDYRLAVGGVRTFVGASTGATLDFFASALR